MPRLERTHSTKYSTVHRSKCAKCYFYCRRITTFLFSHIGLFTLLLGYAFVGAFTFQAIEHQNELEQRKNVIQRRHYAIYELVQMTNKSKPPINRDEWKTKARVILESFETYIIQVAKFDGFRGDSSTKDSSNPIMDRWEFPGALLYSIIVITTIGYGNIAPRTKTGKIVTIAYAIIGIPLMLLCLSNIGHAMAHAFKFVYWNCFQFNKQKKKAKKKAKLRKSLILSPSIAAQRNGYGVTDNVGGRSNVLHVNNSNLLTFPSSNEAGNQSSSSYASSTGPLSAAVTQSTPLNNEQSFFFNQSQSDIDKSQILRRINLGRSLSARCHRENQKQKSKFPPIFRQQKSDPQNQSFVMSIPSESSSFRSKQNSKQNTQSSVICNRYASLSEECLPIRLEIDDRLDLSVPNKMKLSVPPRRTQSQVRFQQPSIKSRRRRDSEETIHKINTETSPSFLTLPNELSPSESYSQPQAHSAIPVMTRTFFPEDSSLTDHDSNHVQPLYYDLTGIEFDDESDTEDGIEKKNIPITICLLLVVGYICGGAWFFSKTEGWSFLDASYFCFVTLSTIGFGDLLPGKTVTESVGNSQTTAIWAFYLLFGMALLAMSLNLVKEKFLETVKSIGKKIGLLVNNDEYED